LQVKKKKRAFRKVEISSLFLSESSDECSIVTIAYNGGSYRQGRINGTFLSSRDKQPSAFTAGLPMLPDLTGS